MEKKLQEGGDVMNRQKNKKKGNGLNGDGGGDSDQVL